MSKLVATKCRRATIALSVASRLFHIARLARIARWSMVPDDAGNSRRRIIRPQSLAGILLSSSTIFLQSSYLWRLSQKILKIKVPPENCHLTLFVPAYFDVSGTGGGHIVPPPKYI